MQVAAFGPVAENSVVTSGIIGQMQAGTAVADIDGAADAIITVEVGATIMTVRAAFVADLARAGAGVAGRNTALARVT